MGQMKDQIESIDDRDLDRIAAIIRSMTPAERHDPKMINGSRRARIARGSGVQVSDVNQLVDRFFEARKMMKQMAGGMGLPGTRRGGGSKTRGKKGKKGKGRGPTPPKVRGGMPMLPPGGMPGVGPGGLNQLPPGMKMPDLSKLNLPKGR